MDIQHNYQKKRRKRKTLVDKTLQRKHYRENTTEKTKD